MHRAELTLDLAAVEHNVETLTKVLDGTALWAVVKANAYGHGALPVAEAALRAGAEALCVATIQEGLALRQCFSSARIIVMGPVSVEDVSVASHAGLECVAHSRESIPMLQGRVKIHLKLNTGMNRWGEERLPQPLPAGTVGVMSHFAHAYADADYTAEQTARFLDRFAYLPGVTKHIANSAATLLFPHTRLDAARCGTALLGMSPLEGVRPEELDLRPTLRWTSYIAQSRRLLPGESVGYGGGFTATRRLYMGVIPVGYGDGFSKRLSRSHVLVGDKPAPVTGVVAMDAIAVTLDRHVPAGTPVTLIGDGLSFEDHARAAGVTNLELATGISADPRRVRRRTIHQAGRTLTSAQALS